MFVTRFYPKTTRIPVWFFLVFCFFFSIKMWPEPIYLKSFLVEHHVCAILTDNNNKKPNNKNNTQTQASKPHSYKTTCALGMFRSGFKHGILSSSHFQIIRWVGCKSHVATLNGHMTLGVG